METTPSVRTVTIKLLFCICIILPGNQTQAKETKTIDFPGKDGLIITADLFVPHPVETPFILLFHQAGWSRGEYVDIAPKLNDMGFNCMAVDLRSGGQVNHIKNLTNQRALQSNKPTHYLDALPDMESAVNYVKSQYKNAPIILWGSSYSASLVILLAANESMTIRGVIAFSPGEYFKQEEIHIKASAEKIICPVFITSASNEADQWKEIFKAIPLPDKHSFLPKTPGNHGSRSLWLKFPDSVDYWHAVSQFLHRYFGPKTDASLQHQDQHKGGTESESPDANWSHPRSEERIEQRRQMVRHLYDSYGLTNDKVLKAMENVPRHWFVPPEIAAAAYNDSPLPIGYDQTISQPFIVAYMTSQLDLDKNKKVLEIGTGSGYQAAVLTEFTPHVYTIEIIELLASSTAKRLKELGYLTIQTKIGDGYKGWPEYQPFDAIIVTAAPESIPQELVRQLAPGGKMILPVGKTVIGQELLLIRKDAQGKTDQQKLMPVRFVPMIHGNSK